jgi:serine/threonine protein kinase
MEDFQLVNVIGRGRYSVVYKGFYRRMNIEVALKCYVKAKLKPHVYEQIAHEIAVHHTMQHTAIVGFYGSFIDPSTGNYYFIHELHNRGDAFNALARGGGKFSENRAVAGVLKSVIHAVAHMHAMNVIHRDIKPENVLLTDDGQAKLTDFGFALHLEWFKPLGRLGTTDYMAPEVVRCDKEFRERYLKLNRAGYGKAVDLWAIGALAYELIVGFPPFQSTSRQQAYNMILEASFKIPAFVSEDGADFIRRCLVLDPSARLKPEEMLMHPWIVSLGVSGGPRGNMPRSVLDFDASFMQGALSAVTATKRASNSLSSKFAAVNISREALDSIKDELDWQYAANNVELMSSGRAETVNRSATAFAVLPDTNAPDSSAVVLSTRSLSLGHKIRRMGSNFVRRFRTRD